MFLDDAWPVVLHADLEAIGTRRLNVHPQLGDDSRFLAGIERVVDRFLYGGEQRLARIIESKQMAVLREELTDRDVALLRGHRFRGDAPALWLTFVLLGHIFNIYHSGTDNFGRYGSQVGSSCLRISNPKDGGAAHLLI